MNKLLSFLLISLTISCGKTAFAADILSIFELAQRNDARFRADQATFQAQQQNPVTARSQLLPALSIDAATGRKRDSFSGAGGGGLVAGGGGFSSEGDATFNSDEYGLSLSQTIYDRRKFLGYKQAKTRAEQSDLEFAIAQQNLIIRVVVDYFAVLAAQDNVDLTVANRKTLRRQLELADERLQVGLGTTTDLFDAQARFSIAEAEEIDAHTILENANQALAELIGHVPATALERLKPDTPLLYPEPNDIDVWVTRALDHNLELAVQKKEEQIALQEIKRQRAGHLPTLDFVVGHGVVDNDGSIAGPGIKLESTDALVQLSLPILEGGGGTVKNQRGRLSLYRRTGAGRKRASFRAADRTRLLSQYDNEDQTGRGFQTSSARR